MSVLREFEYEGWTETYLVRLFYMDYNMNDEMLLSVSVCHAWIPIYGDEILCSLYVYLSYLDLNMNETKWS